MCVCCKTWRTMLSWRERGLLQTKASGHKRRTGSNKVTLSNFGQIWPRASSVTWDNVEITLLKKKKLHTHKLLVIVIDCCLWRKSHLSAILRITSSGQWLNFWGWLKKSACFFFKFKISPCPPFHDYLHYDWEVPQKSSWRAFVQCPSRVDQIQKLWCIIMTYNDL